MSIHQINDFFSLRLSQRRQIAEWLGVQRATPMERDFDYCARVLKVAKDQGKLDELFGRVATLKAENAEH